MHFTTITTILALVCHAIVIATPTTSYDRCGTKISDEAVALLEAQNGDDDLSLAGATSRRHKVTIDVYWHVIALDKTVEYGWIPEKRIKTQIAILNDDFSDTGVTYKLKKITRHVNETWWFELQPDTMQNVYVKSSLREGRSRDLNIWSTGLPYARGLLGYATFPWEYKGAPREDGVVIHHNTLPGGDMLNFNGGQTLTHEIGHWLGLYHTFQGGCDGLGDSVRDTPPQGDPTDGCPKTRSRKSQKDTCPGGGVDPIHNYMDYSWDVCMTEFTDGQVQRVFRQLERYRGL